MYSLICQIFVEHLPWARPWSGNGTVLVTKSERILAFVGELHKNQELKKKYPHGSGCTKGVVFPHQQPIHQLGVQQFSSSLTPTLGVCVDPTGSRISPIRLPPPQTTAAHPKGHLYLQSTGYKFRGSHNPPILGSIICWNDTQNSLYLVHQAIIKDTIGGSQWEGTWRTGC